jgi:hypothetical protein
MKIKIILLLLSFLIFACQNKNDKSKNTAKIEEKAIAEDFDKNTFEQDKSKCKYVGNWEWDKNSIPKFSFFIELYNKNDSLYGYYEGIRINGMHIDESPFPSFKIPFPKKENESVDFDLITGSYEKVRARMVFKNDKILWKLLIVHRLEGHILTEGFLIRSK